MREFVADGGLIWGFWFSLCVGAVCSCLCRLQSGCCLALEPAP
jgi:hypothetical protein